MHHNSAPPPFLLIIFCIFHIIRSDLWSDHFMAPWTCLCTRYNLSIFNLYIYWFCFLFPIYCEWWSFNQKHPPDVYRWEREIESLFKTLRNWVNHSEHQRWMFRWWQCQAFAHEQYEHARVDCICFWISFGNVRIVLAPVQCAVFVCVATNWPLLWPVCRIDIETIYSVDRLSSIWGFGMNGKRDQHRSIDADDDKAKQNRKRNKDQITNQNTKTKCFKSTEKRPERKKQNVFAIIFWNSHTWCWTLSWRSFSVRCWCSSWWK